MMVRALITKSTDKGMLCMAMYGEDSEAFRKEVKKYENDGVGEFIQTTIEEKAKKSHITFDRRFDDPFKKYVALTGNKTDNNL